MCDHPTSSAYDTTKQNKTKVLILMEINWETPKYCLNCLTHRADSVQACTNINMQHLARRVRTNHTAVCGVDMRYCQGHELIEFALLLF